MHTNRTLDYDLYLAVARNRDFINHVPGHEIITLNAFNPEVDINTVEEDVWPVGGLYSFPISNQQTEIFSSSSLDTFTLGSGARTVRVRGINNQGLLRDELVNLDGMTPVSLENQYYRINELRVVDVGSEGQNVGSITLRSEDLAFTMDQIPVGRGLSQKGIFSVKQSFTAYLLELDVALQRSGQNDGIVELRSRTDDSSSWVTDLSIPVASQGGASRFVPKVPLSFVSGSDIRQEVSFVSANNTFVSTNMQIMLVKTDIKSITDDIFLNEIDNINGSNIK